MVTETSRPALAPVASVDSTRHPNLEPILTRPIGWDLIRTQYDEMARYATALQERTADAKPILRRFTRSNVQHPTYRALAELGKAAALLALHLPQSRLVWRLLENALEHQRVDAA